MYISFVTLKRAPKKECVCQKLQRSLRYLWVNSVQVTHEVATLLIYEEVEVDIEVESGWRIRRPPRNYREGLTYPGNCV